MLVKRALDDKPKEWLVIKNQMLWFSESKDVVMHLVWRWFDIYGNRFTGIGLRITEPISSVLLFTQFWELSRYCVPIKFHVQIYLTGVELIISHQMTPSISVYINIHTYTHTYAYIYIYAYTPIPIWIKETCAVSSLCNDMIDEYIYEVVQLFWCIYNVIGVTLFSSFLGSPYTNQLISFVKKICLLNFKNV